MTKEQAINLCNTIVQEKPLFYCEGQGIISEESPINTLLSFLGKRLYIDGDYTGWYASDIKSAANFLREIADALEQ